MKDNETFHFIKWKKGVKMQRSNCQVASDFGHHFPIYKFFVQCHMVKKPPKTKSRSARLSGKPTGMSSTSKEMVLSVLQSFCSQPKDPPPGSSDLVAAKNLGAWSCLGQAGGNSPERAADRFLHACWMQIQGIFQPLLQRVAPWTWLTTRTLSLTRWKSKKVNGLQPTTSGTSTKVVIPSDLSFSKEASLQMGRKVRSGVSQLTLSKLETRSPTITHQGQWYKSYFYKDRAKLRDPKIITIIY